MGWRTSRRPLIGVWRYLYAREKGCKANWEEEDTTHGGEETQSLKLDLKTENSTLKSEKYDIIARETYAIRLALYSSVLVFVLVSVFIVFVNECQTSYGGHYFWVVALFVDDGVN